MKKSSNTAKEYAMRPVSDLIPYEKNPRIHSKEQIKTIAKSIQRFGFTNPILIDKQDRIIAGHGRVMAAKELGLVDVPTLRIEYLTDDEKKAYIIADNQIALKSEWNDELLSEELAALRDSDFDMDLLGFTGKELMGLLGQGTDGLTRARN